MEKVIEVRGLGRNAKGRDAMIAAYPAKGKVIVEASPYEGSPELLEIAHLTPLEAVEFTKRIFECIQAIMEAGEWKP